MIVPNNLRTRRTALNYTSSVALSVATLVVGFVATPLLLRWLGTERFGALRAAGDWLGHLSLLEAGVAGALAPLLAAALAHQDRPGLRRAMHAGLRAHAVVAAAALILGGLVTLYATRLVPVTIGLAQELTNACFVGLLSYALIVLSPFQTLVDAAQRGYAVSLSAGLQSLATTALALAFARAGWGLPGQFAALVIGQGTFRLTLALVARPWLDGFQSLLTEPPDPETTRSLWRLNVPSFLTALAGRAGFYADNIIVALLLGPRAVVPLFLTQRLAALAGGQLLNVGNASWAALAELHALGRRDDFNARLLELTRLIGGLALVALVPIAAYNQHFVARWVGAERFGGDWITALACVNAYLLALLALWGWCFGGTGKLAALVPVLLGGAGLNLVVSVVATQRLGLPGPLVGTLVAVCLVNLWAVPMLLARNFGTPLVALARAAAVPLLWGVPLAFLAAWLGRGHTPGSWPALFAEMAAVASVLAVCWWFLALTTGERVAFGARVRAALSRTA